MRISFRSYAAAVVSLLGLMVAPVLAQDAPKNVNIVSVAGPVSGNWSFAMAALGKVMTDKNPTWTYKLIPGASASNPLRVQKKDGVFSFTQHTMAVAGVQGSEPFRKPVKNVSSIINMHDLTRFHIIVPAESPIKTIDQIKSSGKALSIAPGPRGSVTELAFRWALDEYGISYADIRKNGGTIIFNNYSDTATMMQDGNIDVWCWFGSGEGAAMQELANSMKIRWLSIDPDLLKNIETKHGVTPSVVPASYGGGQAGEGVHCIADTTELIVSSDLPEDVVYTMTKNILESVDDLRTTMPAWTDFRPETAWQDHGFETHPGALRYYREIGVIK